MPTPDNDMIKVLSGASLPLLYMLIKRWIDRRDRNEEGEKAAERSRDERLKKIEERTAEQDAKNVNFQQLIEHMGDEYKQLSRIVHENKERGVEAKLKMEMREEATKDHLLRIENLVNTALSHLK